MGKRIPKSFIDDLINRTNIVSLIGSRLSYAKKMGANYVACCPFHQEKTPSFTVSEVKQFYYCFGCQAGGDALRFLMDYEHLSFVEAVESLAHFHGLTIPYEETESYNPEEKSRLELGLLCLADAAQFFQRCFYTEEAISAREYLRARGIKKHLVDDFLLGYAPAGNQLLAFLRDKYELPLLQAVGLIGEKDGRYYDWFRQRLMFPIRNIRGQIIAFGARTIAYEQPKYLNSAESPWFNKRNELYGFDTAARSKQTSLIVTEGYVDVIKMAQFGLDNAVATLGTAFGDTHLQQLKKRSKKVYFCFDGDAAGKHAAEKALHIIFTHYEEGYDWRFVFLPAGEDPDSFLTQHGSAAFLQLLDASEPPSLFLQRLLNIDQRATWTAEEYAAVVEKAAQWLGLLPQGHYRQMMQKQLQKQLNTSVAIIDSSEKSIEYHVAGGSLAAAPTKLEARMAAVLLQQPSWYLKIDMNQYASLLAKEVPFFYRLLYLLRCGADKAVLEAEIRAMHLEADLMRSRQLFSLLDEKLLTVEFEGMMQELLRQHLKKQARLEKLGN